MKMRENLQDIYKVLTTDETLLRLLYYLPENASDSPLSELKENILNKPTEEKWEIIMDRIKTTQSSDGLDTEPKCRICFYPGNRRGTNNYLLSNQQIYFDILVHFAFDEVDLRMSWILDRINELLFQERITGIGKINFVNGNYLGKPLESYSAYRIIYDLGSGQ